MEQGYQIEEINQKEPRPKLLKIVCILSLISIGLSFLGGVSQLFNGPVSDEDLLNQKVEITKTVTKLVELDAGEYWILSVKKLIPMSESLNSSFYYVTILTLITSIVGFFGVLKMWQGFKIGFHFYIIYSLIGIGQIYLFVSPTSVPTFVVFWNTVLSGIFIFMYSRSLNWLK